MQLLLKYKHSGSSHILFELGNRNQFKIINFDIDF